MDKKNKKRSKKKQNIPLRRRITITCARLAIIVRIAIGIIFYLLFFTTYLSSIRQDITKNIYELTADIGLVLQNLLIEGQVNSSSKDILKVIDSYKITDDRVPIMSIDLGNLKQQLENSSWIKTAIIGRKLPNTIYIGLIERKPIVIWQNNSKLFLVDEEGFAITDQNIEKFTNLLHVVGVGANIYANKLLDDIKKDEDISAKILSAVRYGERRWNIHLEQGILVKMPETDFISAFDYLIELNKAGKLFNQNYKVIDLRDQNKYYIEKYS